MLPRGKNSFRVVRADYFVELQQIEVVGLQAAKGFVNLFRGAVFGVAVNFGHQEGFLAVAISNALPMRISLWPPL